MWTRKLTDQGFLVIKLKSSLRMCYGHYPDWANRYGVTVSQMITHVPCVVSSFQSFPHSWRMTGLWTWVKRWVPLVEQGLLTRRGHPSSPRVLVWCVLCNLFFLFSVWYFWLLCCLSFFELRPLITPLFSVSFFSPNMTWSINGSCLMFRRLLHK
jgi:hypothetical protein